MLSFAGERQDNRDQHLRAAHPGYDPQAIQEALCEDRNRRGALSNSGAQYKGRLGDEDVCELGSAAIPEKQSIGVQVDLTYTTSTGLREGNSHSPVQTFNRPRLGFDSFDTGTLSACRNGLRVTHAAPEPLNLAGKHIHSHAMSIASGSPPPPSPTEGTVDDNYDGSSDDSEDVPLRLTVRMRRRWQDLCQEYHGEQPRTRTPARASTDELASVTRAYSPVLTRDNWAARSDTTAGRARSASTATCSDLALHPPHRPYPTYLHPSKRVSRVNIPLTNLRANEDNADVSRVPQTNPGGPSPSSRECE